MTTAIALAFLFGLGALIALTGQPIGRPRPSIGQRIEALTPELTRRASAGTRAVFRTPLLEELLRAPMERAGEFALAVARRLGLDLGETSARLKTVGDSGGLGLFLGQKLAASLLGLVFLPLASAAGGLGITPSWMWIAMGVVGFLFPDFALRSKSEAKRKELKEELARFADLTALAVSAGQGLESALERVSATSDGLFFEHLRTGLREARLHGRPPASALARLAEELRLADVEPLASALTAAEKHGTAVSQVLRTQARSIRERRRIEIVEAGERAPARMALPVGLLILPAFFIVVLYPAAVQLLQITAK